MVSRKRVPRRKGPRIRKKRASYKKRVGVGLGILGIIAIGVFGYSLYGSFASRHIPVLSPIFEAYPAQGIETKIKEVDRCIYNALLDLSIPPGDVAFKTVETKKDKGVLWTFSGIEIRLPTTCRHSSVKKAFLSRLSVRIPENSVRFVSRSPQRLILDLSIDAYHTHRLAFIKHLEMKSAVSTPSKLPRVAIIIDDLGYDKKIASKFLTLNEVMSFSVLPHSPFQKAIARAINESRRDLLLHLPMEPIEYPQIDPGVGALLSSMTPDCLLDQLGRNLNAVPFIVGVNNHMGSRLTQDPAIMRQILIVLKKRNLFFVDSLTNPQSCSQRVAHQLKVDFARRHVFLDHDQDANAIRFQIRRLISIAKKQGWAIGIGHPHPVTWEVLNDELPNIATQVEFVRVSDVVG
jgi:polysaccharide deacetylase 2 family uncharacterized protein YibQ